MILISSAAYVNHELILEFGKLPPAMLPLQNQRLFHHQIKLFEGSEKIIISLPEGYLLTEANLLF